MKNVKIRLLTASMAVLLPLSLLGGCGTYQKQESTATSSAAASASASTSASVAASTASSATSTGGEKNFRIYMTTEPPSLDPELCNSMAGSDMLYNLMDGLMRNNNGKIEPGVATDYDVSSDGLTYTFHLRDDAMWSDGVQVKAGDFVYGLQRLMDPATAASGAYMGEVLKNGKDVEAGKMTVDQLGVSAPDDKTVVITLDHPAAYFPTMLSSASYFPVRKDLVEKYGKDFASTADKNAYNGPFKLESWEHDSKLTLVKNDKFWNKDAIKIDKVEVSILTDANTPISMYETQQLDYVDIPAASFEQYKDKATAWYTGSMDYLQINLKCGNAALENQNFRKALSYGIDRNAFAKLSRNNMNKPTSRAVLPVMQGDSGNWGDEFDFTPYPLDGDMTQAKDYLQKAMTELGVTDISQMTFKLNYSDNDNTRKIVEAIQAQWKQNIGIDITLNPLPYAVLYDNQASEDFEMMYTGWTPDYDDPNAYLELFSTDGGYNYSQHSNAEFDKYMAESQTTTDPKARFTALFNAEKVLCDDLPIINLDATNNYYLIADNVQGYNPYYVGTNMNFTTITMN